MKAQSVLVLTVGVWLAIGIGSCANRPGAGTLPAAKSKSADRPAPLNVGTRPESVTRGFGGRLYVSVMNGQQPGDGVIKVIKDGAVEVFATGFDEPKGLAFTGEYLVTTDLKRVWKIDAQGRATVLAEGKDFPKPISFLNDTAAADGQSVYVTDMGARDRINGPAGLWPLDSPEAAALPVIGRVYRIWLGGRIEVAVDTNADMAFPNGVAVDPQGGLLVAEFFKGNLISVRDGKIRVLNTGYRGADGIERGADGRIYVSSWVQGKVWRFDHKAKNPEVLAAGFQSAADFLLDEAAGTIVLPDMKAGTLNWLALP